MIPFRSMAARRTESPYKHDPERGARLHDVSIIRGYAEGRPGREQLGEELGGVSQTTIRRWFLGGDMELSTFMDLAFVLEASAGYLIGEVPDEFLDREIKALRQERSQADARRRRRG